MQVVTNGVYAMHAARTDDRKKDDGSRTQQGSTKEIRTSVSQMKEHQTAANPAEFMPTFAQIQGAGSEVRSLEGSNIKNRAYAILKERLINCIYPPGNVLNEAQLAQDIGCSRTPVREAISLLESEGYVTIVPKKGIFVRGILLGDVLQIFQTRLEIEPIALKLAGPNLPVDTLINWRNLFRNQPADDANGFRIDTQMHLFIIEHCHNDYIIEMMKKVFDKNTRIIISSRQNRSHIEDARKEHIEILNTLIDQDFELAATQMRHHVGSCRRAAVDFFYAG